MINEPDRDHRRASAWSRALYYLVPPVVCWFTLRLMDAYLGYYDIGVNPGANRGFLLYIVAPALLAALYAAAWLGPAIGRRWCRSQRLGMLLGLGAMGLIALGVFAFMLHGLNDYPTEQPQSIGRFLEDYLSPGGER
jgi:hypothetical protein